MRLVPGAGKRGDDKRIGGERQSRRGRDRPHREPDLQQVAAPNFLTHGPSPS
jgi:hypothetical protein